MSSGTAKRARGPTRGLGVVVWAYSFLVSPENTDILAWIVIGLASKTWCQAVENLSHPLVVQQGVQVGQEAWALLSCFIWAASYSWENLLTQFPLHLRNFFMYKVLANKASIRFSPLCRTAESYVKCRASVRKVVSEDSKDLWPSCAYRHSAW